MDRAKFIPLFLSRVALGYTLIPSNQLLVKRNREKGEMHTRRKKKEVAKEE